MEWAGALAPMLLASWRTRCPCSRSRRPRAVAVARPSLRPLPPSRSPCRHVAVAPLRLRRHCAFAGDHHAYALCAVLCCLVGHVGCPWLRGLVGRVVGVVVAVLGGGRVRTRLVPYSSAFSAALGFAPLSASSLASLLAPASESLSRGGGDVIILGSSVIDALLTPVRRVAFVARVRIAADAAAARPDGRSRRICLSLVCRAAIVARARRPANGRLRASRPECGMGSISHFSSRWPKQSQYSDSSPPRAHMASS